MKKFYWALAVFLCSIFAIVYGFIATVYFLSIIGFIGALYALFKVVKGVVDPAEEMFVPVVTANQTEVIYLSFDDGPDPGVTPKVLDILQKYNIKAVFFLIGHKVEKYPEIVERILAEGHVIGNHSYSHKVNITFSGQKKVIAEIKRCKESLEKITSQPITWYRPPFGIINPNIGKAIKKMEMKNLGWDFRSYDTNAKDAESLLKRLQYKKIGGIVLFHDNLPFIPEFLEQFMKDQIQKNKKFGNADTLLQ